MLIRCSVWPYTSQGQQQYRSIRNRCRFFCRGQCTTLPSMFVHCHYTATTSTVRLGDRNYGQIDSHNNVHQQQKRGFGNVPRGKAVIRYKDPFDDGSDTDDEKNKSKDKKKTRVEQKRVIQEFRKNPFHKWVPKILEEPTYGTEPDNFRIDIDKRDERKLGGGRTVNFGAMDRDATYEEIEAHTQQQMIRGRFDHNIASENLWNRDVVPAPKLREIKKTTNETDTPVDTSSDKKYKNKLPITDDTRKLTSTFDDASRSLRTGMLQRHHSSSSSSSSSSLANTLANKLKLQLQTDETDDVQKKQQQVPRPVIIKPLENINESNDDDNEEGYEDSDYSDDDNDEDDEDEDDDDEYYDEADPRSSTNPADYLRLIQDPSFIDDLPALPIDDPYWNHSEPLDYTPLLPLMTKEKSPDVIAQENLERQQRYDAIIQLYNEGKVEEWKRVEVFAAAAYHGDTDLILWLYKNECPWDTTVCTAAAAGDQLDVLLWLRTYNCDWDTHTTNAAATLSSTTMIDWIREHGGEWDEETSAIAACNPDEEMLKYLYNNGCPWDDRVCSYAAFHGHLPHLKFAYKRNCPWDDTVCTNAARNGHLNIIQWAREHDCPWDVNEICAYAALFGHLNVIEWVYNNSDDQCALEWDSKVCEGAAYSGRLHILQWLRKHNCPWDETICANAAQKGHWILLQWARENGCPWDAETCANIAQYVPNKKNTPLQMLQWAHNEGCDWDERTCANAALSGNLDMLQYAFNKGCLWDSSTISNAALHGHLNIIQWARKNGCPWDSSTCANAAAGGHLNILQFLRKESCPWDASTCSMAALHGHQNIIEWSRDNGCEWDETSCSNAAANGHFELLKWLRDQNCPWDEATCSNAAKYGHFEILKWARRGAVVIRKPLKETDAEQSSDDDEDDEALWDLGLRMSPEEEKEENERDQRRAELDRLKKEEIAHYGSKPNQNYDRDDEDDEGSSDIDDIKIWDGFSPISDDDDDEVNIEDEYRNLEPRPSPPLLGPVKAIIVESEHECCPWDEKVCSYAAMTGNFAMLEWAHDHGCPWDFEVLVHATRNRDYNILHYALMMGCQWGDVTLEDYQNPSQSKLLSHMDFCCAPSNPSSADHYIRM